MRHACFDVVITIKIAKYVKEQQHKRMTTTNIEPCTKLLFSKALQNQKSINEFTNSIKLKKRKESNNERSNNCNHTSSGNLATNTILWRWKYSTDTTSGVSEKDLSFSTHFHRICRYKVVS